MDLFGLFKKTPMGADFMDSFEEIQRKGCDYSWSDFWGAYDGLAEMACLRQSVHITPDQTKTIEILFDETLERLVDYGTILLKKRRENPCNS